MINTVIDLCPERRSLMRLSNGAVRYPRNLKPGHCRVCNTWLDRGQGCVDPRGMRSDLYC